MPHFHGLAVPATNRVSGTDQLCTNAGANNRANADANDRADRDPDHVADGISNPDPDGPSHIQSHSKPYDAPNRRADCKSDGASIGQPIGQPHRRPHGESHCQSDRRPDRRPDRKANLIADFESDPEPHSTSYKLANPAPDRIANRVAESRADAKPNDGADDTTHCEHPHIPADHRGLPAELRNPRTRGRELQPQLAGFRRQLHQLQRRSLLAPRTLRPAAQVQSTGGPIRSPDRGLVPVRRPKLPLVRTDQRRRHVPSLQKRPLLTRRCMRLGVPGHHVVVRDISVRPAMLRAVRVSRVPDSKR